MAKFRLIIFCFLLPRFCFSVNAESITTPPSCGFFSWNILNEIPLGTANDLPQLTLFGDSRAKFVSEHGRLGNFANASKDGKPLILPGQIKKIQNLGWAGSTASDDPMGLADTLTYFVHPSKTREMTWWRKWDACKASRVKSFNSIIINRMGQ